MPTMSLRSMSMNGMIFWSKVRVDAMVSGRAGRRMSRGVVGCVEAEGCERNAHVILTRVRVYYYGSLRTGVVASLIVKKDEARVNSGQ